ncbi:Flagellar attachment zone protein 1 [Diplonema papillatum]|nr:Flagellar attachment zone protein 1 [Diplonema papillatum]
MEASQLPNSALLKLSLQSKEADSDDVTSALYRATSRPTSAYDTPRCGPLAWAHAGQPEPNTLPHQDDLFSKVLQLEKQTASVSKAGNTTPRLSFAARAAHTPPPHTGGMQPANLPPPRSFEGRRSPPHDAAAGDAPDLLGRPTDVAGTLRHLARHIQKGITASEVALQHQPPLSGRAKEAVEALAAELADLRRGHAHLQAAHEQLQHECNALRKGGAAFERRALDAQATVKRLEGERTGLKAAVREKEKAAAGLEAALDEQKRLHGELMEREEALKVHARMADARAREGEHLKQNYEDIVAELEKGWNAKLQAALDELAAARSERLDQSKAHGTELAAAKASLVKQANEHDEKLARVDGEWSRKYKIANQELDKAKRSLVDDVAAVKQEWTRSAEQASKGHARDLAHLEAELSARNAEMAKTVSQLKHLVHRQHRAGLGEIEASESYIRRALAPSLLDILAMYYRECTAVMNALLIQKVSTERQTKLKAQLKETSDSEAKALDDLAKQRTETTLKVAKADENAQNRLQEVEAALTAKMKRVEAEHASKLGQLQDEAQRRESHMHDDFQRRYGVLKADSEREAEKLRDEFERKINTLSSEFGRRNEDDKGALQRQLADVEAARDRALRELRENEASLRDQVDSHQRELTLADDRLSAQMRSAHDEFEAQKRHVESAAAKERQKLEADVNRLQADLEAERTRLASDSQDAERVRRELLARDDKVREVEAQSSAKGKEVDKLNTLLHENASKSEALAAEIRQEKAKRAKAEAEKTRLDKELAKARSQLQSKPDTAEHERERAELELRIIELENEAARNDEYAAMLREREAQIAALQAVIEKQNEELELLRRQLLEVYGNRNAEKTLLEIMRSQDMDREAIAKQEERARKFLDRHWRRIERPFGTEGSLQIKVKGPSKNDPEPAVVVSEVVHDGAAARAGIRAGMLILQVRNPIGTWNIVTRGDFLQAIGPRGHAFENVEISLFVVTDEKFIAEWKKKLLDYTKTEDRRKTSGSWLARSRVSKKGRGVGGMSGINMKMTPPPHAIREFVVRMDRMSEDARRNRIKHITDLGVPKFGPGFNAENVFAMQSCPEIWRTLVLTACDQCNIKGSGDVIPRSHAVPIVQTLADKLGSTPPPSDAIREAFDIVDLESIGEIDFAELTIFMRELFMDVVFRDTFNSCEDSPTS